jgi:maltose alpha-D-glucosyltransferase/alpha-amylase
MLYEEFMEEKPSTQRGSTMPRRTPGDTVLLADDPQWYKDAIIYELHVRAFADSNDDGVGDFVGLTGKLDYLQDLGVTALWLLPFYVSPGKDDGYDIADYTQVNPAYGTIDDFKEFLEEAHRRGLRVITELVINHTSDQHPWFQRARRAAPGTPERDFYVWGINPKRYAEARIIFKDFETSNWTWDPVANAYYWHRFYSHQPDLNYDNPAVHQATYEVLDFWLEIGIDGLRLDAVPYLYEREGTNCENLPETHSYLKALRKYVDSKYSNRMLLAEANQWPEDAVAYFGAGDESHMNFHFPLMPRLFMALRMENCFPIVDILQQTPPLPEGCQWAIFLRNHDELTLEMVTDEDRDYMYRLYAQDPQARINLGIRRRLAPLLENHRAKIELMNGLLFSLPGTPVLYYGDEIGMGDNIYLGDRNGVRTPMQWSADRNAGFSRANPQRLYLPVIIDPEYHFEAVNVETQQNNAHSLLWWMKRLVALRKHYRAFGRGSLEFIASGNPRVLTFVRRLDDEHILVVANLSRHTQYVEAELSSFQGMTPVEMLGRVHFPRVGAQPYFLTLGPYDFFWFSLEPSPTGTAAASTGDKLPVLALRESWEEVFRGPNRERLGELVLDYLLRCPWYSEKGREIEGVTVQDAIRIPTDSGAAAYITLICVSYTEGEPVTYQLPLAYAAGGEAARWEAEAPERIVYWLLLRDKSTETYPDGEPGVLYDPIGDRRSSQALLQALLRGARLGDRTAELLLTPLPGLGALTPTEAACLEPRLLKDKWTNAVLAYDERLFLKVFRRVEPGVHPEVEVGRFLTERTSFQHAAPVAGLIELRRGRNDGMVLGVWTGFIPNQGDAWTHTLHFLEPLYDHALTLRGHEPDLSLPRRPFLDVIGEELPQAAQDVLGSYLESARLLGQRVAELHLALSAVRDDPAFAPEPFSTLYQRSLYQSFRSQVRQTFETLRKRLPSLQELARPEAEQLLGREDEVLRRARRIFEHKITAERTRCHCDLQLDQLLNTGKDFYVIDLEAEADRPLSDRRRKRTPLRDVAGMMFSFGYASFAAAHRPNLRPEDIPALVPWSRYWMFWVCVAFVQSYLATCLPCSFLPQRREELAVLLDFCLLKRAAHYLHIDLRDDDARVEVPLRGFLRILEEQG